MLASESAVDPRDDMKEGRVARGSAVDEWVCAEGFGYRYVRRAVGNEGRLGDGCGDGWTSRLWPR